MRLGIDISAVVYGTGVSRYTSNLVRSLVPLLSNDQLILFGSSLRQKPVLENFVNSLPPSITPRIHAYPPSLVSVLFNTLHVDISRLTGPLDVFHAWDWYIPAIKHGALVSTVHDLALFKFPDTAHPSIKKHHQRTLELLKAHAVMIIAVSRSTKMDLVNLFHFDPQRIVVIPEALPREVAIQVSPEQIAQVKRRYRLTKPYILMVGTREKRKNYPLQIAAWQHFKDDYQLVIVGRPGDQEIKMQAGMILTDSLDPTTLACLYAGSALLLYASIYEGFGLPILEAFFHRTPVVTSNLSAMPEVAGNAAMLVDPVHVQSIIIGIGKALQSRQQLIGLGDQRVRQFSWETVAQQTLQAYQQALAVRPLTSQEKG